MRALSTSSTWTSGVSRVNNNLFCGHASFRFVDDLATHSIWNKFREGNARKGFDARNNNPIVRWEMIEKKRDNT